VRMDGIWDCRASVMARENEGNSRYHATRSSAHNCVKEEEVIFMERIDLPSYEEH